MVGLHWESWNWYRGSEQSKKRGEAEVVVEDVEKVDGDEVEDVNVERVVEVAVVE